MVYIIVKRYINGRNILTIELLGAYEEAKIAEEKIKEYKKDSDKYSWYNIVEMPLDEEKRVKVSF